MPVPRTLYLIADGGRVRYVERAGPGHFRTFLDALSAHMHDKTSEFGHGARHRHNLSTVTTRYVCPPSPSMIEIYSPVTNRAD